MCGLANKSGKVVRFWRRDVNMAKKIPFNVVFASGKQNFGYIMNWKLQKDFYYL